MSTHLDLLDHAKKINRLLIVLWPGLTLSGLLAIVAVWLGQSDRLAHWGLGALTIAIVLGMFLGNSVYSRVQAYTVAGVDVSRQRLLRWGIVLYGLRLTFQDIAQVGVAGVLIDCVVLTSTFFVALVLGTRFLGMDRNLVILIGAGSSICGAAAVLATEPVVRGKSEHVAIAIASVVLYGTLSIFLYPVLYHIGQDWHFLHLGESTFGVYAGSTVHEVAQVVAAARNVSEGTAHAAVITKMVRVMMLAPFLALLSFYLARSPGREEGEQGAGNLRSPMRDRIKLPWFALVFVGVVALNSMGIVSASSAATLGRVDTIMLAMAMGALGLTTRLASIRKAGFKPLLLGALLYAWLIFGGALLNGAIQSWLGTTVR